MRRIIRLITAISAAFLSWVAHASPCDGIDRTLTDARKAALAPEIAKQIKVKSVDVLQSYSEGTWHILYTKTHVTDNAFIFYKADPMKSMYVVAWGGKARPDEEAEIAKWVEGKAKGIPPKLAQCFAWHVTKDRDM